MHEQTQQPSGSAGRAAAEDRACELYIVGGTLTQQDVCWMLEPWVGNKNVSRKRVTPDGWDFVRSDTVGLVTTHQGEVRVGNLTWRHPYVCRILNKYIRGIHGKDFAWTSITINAGFQSKRHRDCNSAWGILHLGHWLLQRGRIADLAGG